MVAHSCLVETYWYCHSHFLERLLGPLKRNCSQRSSYLPPAGVGSGLSFPVAGACGEQIGTFSALWPVSNSSLFDEGAEGV